jgi:hypothetical protein
MELSLLQDFAIQARVASVIGASVFDRVFAGVRFAETDGPLLYVYSRDEQSAAEIEDDFSTSHSGHRQPDIEARSRAGRRAA